MKHKLSNLKYLLPSYHLKKLSRGQKRYFDLLLGAFLVLAVPLVITQFIQPKGAGAVWFNDNWGYRQAITATVTSNSSDITNLQTLITVDTSTPITASKMQSSCQDLRFTSQGGNILPYYIDSGCNGASTKIWVLADLVPKNTTTYTLYMYYGNPSAVAGTNPTLFNLYNGLIGYWAANEASWNGTPGEVKDSSVKGANGTAVGNATTTSSGKFANAGTYDGSGDYVTVSTISGNSGTQTVASWIYIVGAVSGNQYVFDQGGNNNWIQVYNSHIRSGNSTSAYCDGATTVTTGTWYHVAKTYDGITVRVYLNGVLDCSVAGGSATPGAIRIGDYGGGGLSFNGRIDETRLYNRALSGSEITQLYNSTDSIQSAVSTTSQPSASFATEEKGPSPSAYWKFDEGTGTTAKDSTTNANNGTLTNGPTWQTEDQCISGKCLYFNGSTSYINSGNSNSLKITGNMTLSAWIKISDYSGHHQIMSKHSLSTDASYDFWIDNGTGRLYFRIYSNGTSFAVFNSPNALSTNQWHYVTGVYNGSNMLLYVDGVQVASGAYSGGIFNSNANLTIGSDTYGTGGVAQDFFKGFIDEPKIYNYARSAAQIQADYNSRANNEGAGAVLGTANNNNFNALNNGLVGYWKMDESSWNGTSGEVVDSSGNGNHGTAANSATTTTGKFGNGGSFDGSTKQAAIPESSSLRFTTSSTMTFSAWVNPSAVSTTQVIIGNRECAARISLHINSSGKAVFNPSPTSVETLATGTTTLSTNTWYLITGTYDSTTAKVYVNGTLEGSQSLQGAGNLYAGNSYYIGGNTYVCGTTQNLHFNGTIDEARIYNRSLSPAEVSKLYTFAPGPKVYLKMDEGSGTTANDSSGNANTGTVNNGTWSTGKYGKGVKVDGTTGSDVSVPDFGY